MSGPRPLHLSRRGAVYVIRLTLPKDLQDMTGVIDIHRSLQTKAIDVARRRCLDAEKWFNNLIRQLRAMGNPTRHDIWCSPQAPRLSRNGYGNRHTILKKYK